MSFDIGLARLGKQHGLGRRVFFLGGMLRVSCFGGL